MRLRRTTPQRKRRNLSLFSLLLIVSLLLPPLQSVQGRDSVQSSQLEATQSSVNRSQFDEPNNGDTGLTIHLSEGAEQPDAVSRPPLADPNPLTSDEVQLIADRLPALEEEAEDVQEFRLPPDSPPPPRTGDTIDEAFPPQQDVDASEVVTDGPLEILRFAPDGDVPIAPFINVTFNQPMVPLGTLAQLAAEEVPVQVTPALEGEWKWLGTRTLSFEAASDEVDRLPMATEYTVEIPAGTESATGNLLEGAVTWTFRTPPPTVQNFAPTGSPQPLDPIFFAGFDQRIDPETVLETISVTAGGQEYPVRLATKEEVADDTRAASLSKNSPESRWIAFRTVNKLPTNTTVNVNIGPGTPSFEGPRVTESAQSYSFQTYAPLQIFDHRCGYGRDCPPFSPFLINFNNGLDESLFDPSLITIEPEIPNVTIQQFGNTLQIQGTTSGRTTYQVTVSGDIQDVFGQTLGADETLTFEVGSAEPSLSGPRDMTITLDPSSAAPVFTVYSINYTQLRYRAYAVDLDDWSAYQTYRRDYYNQEKPPAIPGREVANELIDIQAQPDELTETAIDLSDALQGAQTGHLIVVVDVPQGILSKLFGNGRRIEPAQSWVQVTQIGLDAVVDHSTMIAWANRLTDGAPLADIDLALYPTKNQATTGADGTATIELPSQFATLLVAQNGDDLAFLPQSPWSYYGDEGWRQMPVRDELRWYVWDDRQMYKPGEEVHVKGWLRKIGGDINGDVGLLDSQQTVSYRVMGAQGNDMTDGQATVNAAGGFDLNFTLPENANLGFATLQLTASGSVSNLNSRDYWHNFQIQEFRRPEFEVSAGNESTGPYFIGDEAVVFVQASYFSGGPLPNAETFWSVSSSPTNYSPPGWGDFTFGTWTPWWYFGDFYGGSGGSAVESYTSSTDASGAHYLKLNFDAATDPRPYSVSTDATVMDVNRQAWSASTNLMVHPSNLYVGIQSERTFVKRGEPLEVEAVVVDVDGAATGGQQISMTAARLQWKNTNGRWMEEEVDPQECVLTSSAFPAENPVTCTFNTDTGGRYRITATVEDEQGRLNQSQFTRWVSGGKRPPARNVEQEEANLIPDKEEYQPGDVAEILVQSPFAPAEGMMTIARNGILYTERFEMAEESIVLQVPIEDEHIPNLIVQVDLVGSAPRLTDDGEPAEGVPARPAYASGRLDLSILPLSRTLALDVAPQDEAVEPGAETALDVTLSDAKGEPVSGAELAVIVVDEAVLALSNYQLADPLAVFYGSRHDNTSSYHSRSNIVLANPELLAAQGGGGGDAIAGTAMPQATTMMRSAAAPAAAPMADGMAMEEPAESLMAFDADDSGANKQAADAPAIDLRTNFDPLALFAPEVTTDAEGKATIDITLPDNLTRYRVMVVAVADGNKFGSGESNITARLPLMVRPSAPRFLNFGDRFELPIVIQNQTDEDTEVDVVVRASNIDLVEGEDVPDAEIDSSGQRVIVPANDRIEVRFPAATLSAGTARFQIAISSETFADAATADLPVYTPATTEAFATYGVIDEGAIVQPVAAPEDVFPQFGVLEIDTSSTALQALTDALIYLTSYPYDCSEQIASRIMAVGALRDVLTAFDAEGLPTPAEMEAAVERDVERLASLQNNDGGYPIWQRGRESVPYYSIFVPHALHIAKEKGFAVSNKQQIQALSYLRDIESYYPAWYGQRTRYSLSAYALYVRSLLGDVDTTKANSLFAETGLDEMPLEGLAWLLHIFSNDAASAESAAEIRRHFGNRAVETAGAANFTTSYGDDEWVMLHSNRRTDGVILDALITDQPESDLIPKVVTGLLAHRERGRWNNTQENAFILLALDRYFNTFEAETPDFVANIWLGEDFVGGHEYVGRTANRRSTDVPISYLVDESDDNALKDLVINKEGDGRLYYRLGLRYAPTDLDMPPIDRGFVVQRTYEAVDDPDDVVQGEDGVWQIKAGARVRVRLTMIADNRRYHVALVDPLPAGLEIINPALAVSQEVPSDPNDSRSSTWWWYGTWYNHQNLRDERAEAFANLLWDGVHSYTYVARATTPGEFIVPPSKAEEMYSPEVFGRSGSDKVVVVVE